MEQTYQTPEPDARLQALHKAHRNASQSITTLATDQKNEAKIKKLLFSIKQINEKKLQLYREGGHAKI